jgi:hypothetical protein
MILVKGKREGGWPIRSSLPMLFRLSSRAQALHWLRRPPLALFPPVENAITASHRWQDEDKHRSWIPPRPNRTVGAATL